MLNTENWLLNPGCDFDLKFNKSLILQLYGSSILLNTKQTLYIPQIDGGHKEYT